MPASPTGFVGRVAELAALESWWGAPPTGRLGLVWGRRRVGKTALLQRFAGGRRTVFHTGAGRPPVDELRALATATANTIGSPGTRELGARPFTDWRDALDTLAAAAQDEPLLLVLDEFPDLVTSTPSLPGELRAFWDVARDRSKLRILLSGSAIRTMQAMQEERAPLYGRIDLALQLHPFGPSEVAAILPTAKPAERALIWGLVGGMPLYLSWWDSEASLRANLLRLAGVPGGQLLIEGQLVLATESGDGPTDGQILRAIAAGRTKYGEIRDAVQAEPARALERLIALRLVERSVPVTDDLHRGKRRSYRIADNFLAFWLSLLEPHRAEIERGLGSSIVPVIERSVDDHLGDRWEEAFRIHLRTMAAAGSIGPDVVAIGPWWRDVPPTEIDAVALAGRSRQPILVGEAKWSRSVDGAKLVRVLTAKARMLADPAPGIRYAVAAREEVRDVDDTVIAITAADIFGV